MLIKMAPLTVIAQSFQQAILIAAKSLSPFFEVIMKIHTLNKGFGLIEIMIALSIGLFMLTFGIQALMAINSSFLRIKENAKMQETARFAFELLQQDINRSKYWRNMLNFSQFSGTASQSDATIISCSESGSSWARKLSRSIFALNDTTQDYQCVANDNYLGGDILTLRYPEITPVVSYDNEQLYIRTNTNEHRLFLGVSKTDISNNDLPLNTITQLIKSHSYFIADSQRYCKGFSVPALFWQTLVNARPQKEELLSGVEQLQIRLLVDQNEDGLADSYLNPNQVNSWLRVHAVKVWLLMRSDCPDPGFNNSQVYQLGDQVIQYNDHFRRQLYQFTFNYQTPQ